MDTIFSTRRRVVGPTGALFTGGHIAVAITGELVEWPLRGNALAGRIPATRVWLGARPALWLHDRGHIAVAITGELVEMPLRGNALAGRMPATRVWLGARPALWLFDRGAACRQAQ